MSQAKLYNIGFISSAAGGKISGGSIYGNWVGQIITDSYVADNLTLTNLSQVQTKSHTVLSDIGTLTHDGLETQFTNWGGSSQKIKNASDWYIASSMKLSESGQKYSDLYTWYQPSTSQYTNWLSSGEKLSRWFKESSMKLGEIGFSGEKYTAAYQHSGNHYVHPSSAINTASGMVATYWGANTGWINNYPPLQFGLGNTFISAQQVIELAKFDCGTNAGGQPKRAYIWQAFCCDSSQTMRGAFAVQVISGTTMVYKNSSATLNQGYPLAVTDGGKTIVRFAYSSTAETDINGAIYGTCGIQMSVL